MKRLVSMLAVFALAISAPALACGKDKAMADCPMGMKGVEKSVANIDNGVKITLTAKDAEQVKAMQAKFADTTKHEGCACPMCAEGVKRQVENTANGVILTVTTTDKDQLAKIQAFAANAGKGECMRHKGEHAAHGDHAAKGAGDCPHAKADRT